MHRILPISIHSGTPNNPALKSRLRVLELVGTKF